MKQKYKSLFQNEFDTNKNVINANNFYYTHVDILDYPIYFEKIVDLENMGIDMNFCRAYCKCGTHYSASRFKEFVATLFDTNVSEMNKFKQYET